MPSARVSPAPRLLAALVLAAVLAWCGWRATTLGMASFKAAESRYADAASLQERVAQHLADVTRHRVANTTVTRHGPSAEAGEIIGMLRHPQTVRRAILASIVLGPPRALEN